MRLVAVSALLFVALPILAPLRDVGILLDALAQLPSEAAWYTRLAGRSIALGCCASVIAVPVGTFSALLTVGISRRYQRLAVILIAIGIFLPAPIHAISWQVLLGRLFPPTENRPWNEGLLPAAFVHGMAAIPWVTAIVAAALLRVDRNLVERARMTGGNGFLVRRVLLPRAASASLIGLAFTFLQTGTEIAVTDTMRYDTFAEEVYSRYVTASTNPGGATLAALCSGGVTALGVAWILRKATPLFLGTTDGPRAEFSWGHSGWILGWLFLWILPPFVTLAFRAALGSEECSFPLLGVSLEKVIRSDGRSLTKSLLLASFTGLAASTFALVLARDCRDSRWLRYVVVGVALIAVSTPAPLVGLGMKRTIFWILQLEENILSQLGIALPFPPLRSALYDQPSPVVIVWVSFLRFFPLAFAIAFHEAAAVPRSLRERALMEGRGTFCSWRDVEWPYLQSAWIAGAALVAAASLGEVAATKLSAPPQAIYILVLFDHMHYGPESTTAALALVQSLAVSLLVITAFVGSSLLVPNRKSES